MTQKDTLTPSIFFQSTAGAVVVAEFPYRLFVKQLLVRQATILRTAEELLHHYLFNYSGK